MGNAVEQRAGQSYVTCISGHASKGRLVVMMRLLSFVGAAGDLEEEFGAGFGKGNIAELVENEQVESFDAFEQALELAVLPAYGQNIQPNTTSPVRKGSPMV